MGIKDGRPNCGPLGRRHAVRWTGRPNSSFQPFRGFRLSESNGRTDTSGPTGVPGTSRRLKLAKGSELRAEVGPDKPVRETPPLRHRAPSGELARHPPSPKDFHMEQSATIELDGISEVEYVANETPMVSYVDSDAILDGRRLHVKASQGCDVDSSQALCFLCVSDP
ncbi:protein CLP1 homolog [Phoenix dactylifera]|uniref:Protein CLP1 homolog n=1 Tax=Phoenix dactylifera TaxID=42345 RepID=A0A8B9AID6_PHODC|nr:protein CLP1 homolog [Phoenix dactylifera]